MTEMLMVLAPVLAALLVAAAATRYLASDRAAIRVLDQPNHRSMHVRPTPRTGGLGVLVGLSVGWLLLTVLAPLPAGFGQLAGAAALIAAISILDDVLSLPAAARFVVHLLAAGWLAWLVGAGPLPSLGFVLVVLGVAWMTNLYNFMDGLDGLAGGMALFGFGTLAALGIQGGDPMFAAISATVAAAALGFLFFNLHPARIFMGDGGSSTLGFLVGALTVWGAQRGIFQLWQGALAFAPFIVDASVTLARRIAGGEKPWRAHRTHYYQRLAQSGWGHRRTALLYYGLMVASGAVALVARERPAAAPWLLAALAVVYGAIGVFIDRRLPRSRLLASST